MPNLTEQGPHQKLDGQGCVMPNQTKNLVFGAKVSIKPCHGTQITVTGPPGALLFDVKPEIALKESLELLF